MVVVNIRTSTTTPTESIISDGFSLNSFKEIFTLARKHKGVKYNALDNAAFEDLVYIPPDRRVIPPIIQGKDIPDPIPPYPQILHVNVLKSDGNPHLDVHDYYEDHYKYFDCYTFSFGWEEEGSVPAGGLDVQAMLNIAEDFHMKKKNLVIDPVHLPKDTDAGRLFNKFTTITLKSDEDYLKSDGLQTLSELIASCTKNYKEKLMLEMPQWLKTHAALYTKNEDLTSLSPEDEDTVTIAWKSVTKLSDLDKTVAEDIIKVDIKGIDPNEMFLGKDFATFIEAFAKNQKGKGLQLNINDQIEIFRNIQHPTLSKIPTIPFGIKLEVTNTLDYNNNKWLDAYTLFFSAGEGTDAYTKPKIQELITNIDLVTGAKFNKYISLDLERARKPGSEDAMQEIKASSHGVNVVAAKAIEAKTLKTFLRTQSDPIFLDWPNAEEQKTFFTHASITDLIPGLKDDLLLLEFTKPIEKLDELKSELKENNRMIQLDVKEIGGMVTIGELDLETCLEELSNNGKNGAKLHFSTSAAWDKTLEKNYLKYLNFPVWLELDVEESSAINLETNKDILKKLKHKVILGFGTSAINAVAMKAEREKISTITDVTYAIKTKSIANKLESEEVKKLFEEAVETMLVSYSEMVAKDFRKNFPENVKYYLNVPDRLVMEECPEIAENDPDFDFSKFTISDYVTDIKQIEKFIGHFDMIKAKVVLTNGILYVNKDITLEKFFETFETASKDKAVGIVFTLDGTSYEKAMEVPQMKTFDHPIWFDVKVVNTHSATSNQFVDLQHNIYNDKLDCRTLLLGVVIPDTIDEYSPGDIAALEAQIGGNDQKYVFDLKYAKKSWSILEGFVNNKNLLLRGDARFVSNSATFRKEFENIDKSSIIFDIEGRKKYSMWDCPEGQDIFTYFRINEDVLSELVFSDFITSKDDIKKAINDKNHMLNVNVKYLNDVIVSNGFTLLQLLETVDESDKLGIKLTFDLAKDYEATASDIVLVQKLKSMDRPIWINADVIGVNGKVHINLDYDKNDDILDCRALSLGWLGTTEDKYSDKNLKAMKGLSLGPNDRMYVVDMIHVVNTFSSIKDILLMDETTDVRRVKPRVEPEKVKNGNKIMLSIKDDDLGKLDTAGLQKILDENEDLLFLDMTFRARKFLFKSGSAALSSSLILTLVLVFVTMIFG